MKVLKIQLQNINSLKSDSPIVIDFEGEAFKDIGLFAITGATGAGKTTILDAIMIALYHKIPRLNISGVGALEMAISHGTTTAFVTLDFENDGIIYQAHWDVQTESKTGKPINPKHNFSIKNLTSKEIIASGKKTAVFDAIESIVTLTADQFLRSVLLAQGEFAAFLNANGTEKAKLLEQITGEEIYNQIGQKTLERKGLEEKLLEKISNKINFDDLISPEQMVVLKEEQSSLGLENKENEKLQKKYNEGSAWYKKESELITKHNHLEQEKNAFFINKNEAEEDLQLLIKNQEAEPFRLLISQTEENQQSRKEHINLIQKNEGELVKVEEQIEEHNCFVKDGIVKQETANAEFTKWQPILQELIEIEQEFSTVSVNKEEKEKQLRDSKSGTEKLTNEKIIKTEKQTLFVEKLAEIEGFLDSRKNMPEVEKCFSDWKVQLTQLKEKKTNHAFEVQKQKVNQQGIEQNTADLLLLKDRFSETKTESGIAEEKVKTLSAQLEKNSIQDIIKEKDKNQKAIGQWQELQKLTVDHAITSKLISNEQQIEKDLLAEQQIEEERVHLLKAKQLIKQELLNKANTILEQQKLIQKYEKDRAQLTKDEPCYLCGSKSHPFVSEYQAPKISDAEKEVVNKTQVLEETQISLQQSQKQVAVVNAKLENVRKSLWHNEELQYKLTESAEKKGLSCTVDQVDLVEKELKVLLDKDVLLTQQIEVNSGFQQQKHTAEMALKIIVAKEQQQSQTLTITTTQLDNLKQIDQQAVEFNDSESKLIEEQETAIGEELSKFKMKVPSPEKTVAILLKIETGIAEYNSKKEEKQATKQEKSNIQTEVEGLEKQLNEFSKQQKKLTLELTDVISDLKVNTKMRVSLLPAQIRVTEKRNELQTQKENREKQLAELEKAAQNFKSEKIKFITSIKTYQTSLTDLTIKKVTIDEGLKSLFDKSGFTNLVTVSSALLPVNEKEKLTRLKEKLINKETELKALETQFKKDFVKLKEQKGFEQSAEEIEILQSEIKVQTDKNNHRLGELTQQFGSDKKLREDNNELVNKKDKQQLILDKWSTLYRLLGGSKDAFNTYVQRITLKNLLLLANIHLFKLNKRYELFMDPVLVNGKELEFTMIDRFHNDQTRAIDTASGGEKFLISLALALGLADLTSRNMTIDSLFIDEGFGTLDQNALESAMHTLETLQSEGKLIGIISHVENLKERIPTQIQVSKRSNGVSEVKVVSGG
jgi:exonuclease SbcC